MLSGESGLNLDVRNAPYDRRERCGDQQQSHARLYTRNRFPVFEAPCSRRLLTQLATQSHSYMLGKIRGANVRLAPLAPVLYTSLGPTSTCERKVHGRDSRATQCSRFAVPVTRLMRLLRPISDDGCRGEVHRLLKKGMRVKSGVERTG
jgi:hypothetical protein